MATLTITLPEKYQAQWIQDVDCRVCTNGSEVRRIGRTEAELVYPNGSSNLTPQQVATFIRNYMDEGFDMPFNVSFE